MSKASYDAPMSVPCANGRKPWASVLCSILLFGCGSEESEPFDGPNVVLISIDSLRADHLGSYGYGRETSPFLDQLASEGVRFENAVSTTSWTLPAHAALFTGLVDSAHGVVDNGQTLSENNLTLAEVLQGHGYHTAGFFGGPYLHETFGLAQGFDVWESCMGVGTGSDSVRREAMSEASSSHGDVTGERTLDAVRRWLAGGVQEPAFLFLHMWDVHYDYIPPAEYVERFDPNYQGPIDGRNVANDPRLTADMDPRDLEHLVARYDGEIRYTDDVLRRILAELETAGFLQDAIVVVTSDHGEEFFEHGGKGHQRTLFDEVLRVPLIFHSPGRLPAGTVLNDQVRLIDLMPTLVRLAGIDAALPLQGRDLGDLWRGGSLDPVPALAELSVNDEALFAVRTNEEKLLVNEKSGTSARYDLEQDPGELRALELDSRAELDAAREDALRWRRYLGTRAGTWEGNAELVETLRALGYLGDD